MSCGIPTYAEILSSIVLIRSSAICLITTIRGDSQIGSTIVECSVVSVIDFLTVDVVAALFHDGPVQTGCSPFAVW